MPDVETHHRTPSCDVEEALLHAAARLLAGEGADALSVRRIAAEAGCAPMGVYTRFGGKQGVVGALFREGFARLADAFASIDLEDPLEALIESGRRYRDFALANPAAYSLMFERSVREFEPSDEDKAGACDAFLALVARVRTAIAAGRIGAGDPEEIAQRLWASSHGAVSLELRGMGFVEDRDAHYEALLQTLVRGLGATT